MTLTRMPGARSVSDDAAADQDDDARSEQIRHLRELIDALDRRVPHIERSGEIKIARDAAELREKALRRIAALKS